MTSSSRIRVYLIDANSLLYRGHFAFANANLITSRGLHTGALHGFMNMLLALFDQEQPDRVAVAFDKSDHTFRNDLYSEYKGTRAKTPEELVPQFPYARELIRAMKLPVLEVDGYEADDILGSLARRFTRSAEADAVVVTGDRDALQLVDEHTSVLMTKKGIKDTVLYDPARVQSEYGVTPPQLIDVKALQGDTSDNIPGVPGVGPKTACRLIARYGTLDGVYENLHEQKGKLLERLRDNKDQAYLSQDLARIRLDVDLPLTLDECRPGDRDRKRLVTLFSELEMRTLAEMIEPESVQDVQASRDYALVRTAEALDAALSTVSAKAPLGVFLVSRTEDPSTRVVSGIALAPRPGKAWYVPIDASASPGAEASLFASGPGVPAAEVARVLSSLLEAKTPQLTGHDLKEALLGLWALGVEGPVPLAGDTLLASYVHNPSRTKNSLADLMLERLGHKALRPREGLARGQPLSDLPLEDLSTWACECADLPLRLWEDLRPELDAAGLEPLLRDLEMPLVPVLARMEQAGIRVDPRELTELSRELAAQLATLEKKIHGLAGGPFNVASPKQLAHVLFEKLGLPVIKKTKTGPSTAAGVLETLEREHGCEIAALINQHRHLAKLKNTYLDTLPGLISPATGRIHSSFNQAAAATGRLSSINPNLQNIPTRTELGHRIRHAFLPGPEGWVLLGADYSQIELRILAHLSGSRALSEAFASGEDIHRRTASLVFGIPADQVQADMRSRAKAVNFGIIYGMSAFGLSQRLGLTQHEAKRFIERYFEQLPEVRAYLDQTLETARQQGYVTTLLGRRRLLPELTARSAPQRQFAERTAVNTPIQGSAADLIKKAMVRMQERLDASGLKARMLLQLHDELVFECPEDETEALGAMVREVMEGAMQLSVPLVANVHSGPTWADLK